MREMGTKRKKNYDPDRDAADRNRSKLTELWQLEKRLADEPPEACEIP